MRISSYVLQLPAENPKSVKDLAASERKKSISPTHRVGVEKLLNKCSQLTA
jgi:hypothetical protein